MSYCRYGEHGSDTYIYWSYEPNGIACHCCTLSAQRTYLAPTFTAMLSHVEDHRAAGDHIPPHVDEELRADAAGYADDPARTPTT